MCKPYNSISFACVCVRQREDMCVKERVRKRESMRVCVCANLEDFLLVGVQPAVFLVLEPRRFHLRVYVYVYMCVSTYIHIHRYFSYFC